MERFLDASKRGGGQRRDRRVKRGFVRGALPNRAKESARFRGSPPICLTASWPTLPSSRTAGERKHRPGAVVTLRRWTPDGRTIAIGVAVDNGANVGVDGNAARHLLQFIFSDEAGVRTGEDSADFFVSVHLAPFIQTKFCLQSTSALRQDRTGENDRPGAEYLLCWYTPWLHVTIAVCVAGCSVNGAWVGLETSRHLIHLILSDEARARTGKDSAYFFVSVHLAPFIQTKCCLSYRRGASLSVQPRRSLMTATLLARPGLSLANRLRLD